MYIFVLNIVLLESARQKPEESGGSGNDCEYADIEHDP